MNVFSREYFDLPRNPNLSQIQPKKEDSSVKQIRIFCFQTIQLKISFLQREENMLQWAIKGRFPVGGVDIGVLIWGDPWGGKNAAAAARHVPPPRSSVRATAADPQVQMQRAPAVRALAFYLPVVPRRGASHAS